MCLAKQGHMRIEGPLIERQAGITDTGAKLRRQRLQGTRWGRWRSPHDAVAMPASGHIHSQGEGFTPDLPSEPQHRLERNSRDLPQKGEREVERVTTHHTPTAEQLKGARQRMKTVSRRSVGP